MANLRHVELLRKGAQEWNAWRRTCEVSEFDLCGADLRGANLAGVDLSGIDLSRADFQGANLSVSNFQKASLQYANFRETEAVAADLTEADLHGAVIIQADFRSAKLDYSNLSEASLGMVSLNHASLIGADFSSALLGWVLFANTVLVGAKGLDTCVHRGPSTVGLDTVQRFGRWIPDSFLRGCGVSEMFIAYAKSLIESPFEFYSCFISYSTKDQDFADQLYSDLRAKGVRCWFAPHHIQAGQKIHEQIDEAIRVYDKLLLVLSPSSMGSEWVKTEISKARKREISEGNRVLFPVRLVDFNDLRDWECFDADVGKDSAREIREYFIPDFSQWNINAHAYRLAFERLMRDLNLQILSLPH